MKKIDLNSILPDEGSSQFGSKEQLPYGLLIEYADAINKKYKGKLKAFVTESSQIRTNVNNEDFTENLIFALSLEAAIGQGYLYRLIEVQQLRSTIFPVKVKVFRDHVSVLGTYKDFDSFYDGVIGFLDSGIVKTIIMNLLGMVDLYNETRNDG